MNRVTLCVLPNFGMRICSFRNGLRVAGVLVALMAPSGALMAARPAGAMPSTAYAVMSDPTVAIYRFDTNGDPVLIPDATILNGGVFTDAGFFGNLNPDGSIVNNGVVVGFVSYSSPDN